MTNAFLDAVNKYDVYTENGAVSNSTTGSALVDYFAQCGTYRERTLTQVGADFSKMWAESPLIALQIMFYNRIITRSTKGLFTSTEVQKGQGNRDEFRKNLVYLAINKPDVLAKNLWLVPLMGCWKDLWHEDVIQHLDRDQVYDLVMKGMTDPYNRDLISKYIPKIRSKRNCSTPRHTKLNEWARGLCSKMGWTEKEYRLFKSSGTSHKFQQCMSKNLWNDIDFNRIPGKALFTLANHRDKKDKKTTIERHGLEAKYLTWLGKKPVAKFTGYPYELHNAARMATTKAQKMTIDKQFDGLIDLAKKDRKGLTGNVWCALDTSSSMMSSVTPGNKVSCLDVCIGLGIYFSSLNEGAFKDNVIMFDNISRKLKLAGSFTDKVAQIHAAEVGWGGTNFQSVIDEIVRVRKTNPNIPLDDYPTTLLVVSDMQFNPTGTTSTNYEEAMKKLTAVGLPKISVIWWNVTARGKDKPSTIQDEGTTLIGGFDGSAVTLILSGDMETVDTVTGKTRKLTPAENMLKALDQELLRQIKI